MWFQVRFAEVDEYADNIIKEGLSQGLREIFCRPSGRLPDTGNALMDMMNVPKLFSAGAHLARSFYRAKASTDPDPRVD